MKKELSALYEFYAFRNDARDIQHAQEQMRNGANFWSAYNILAVKHVSRGLFIGTLTGVAAYFTVDASPSFIAGMGLLGTGLDVKRLIMVSVIEDVSR